MLLRKVGVIFVLLALILFSIYFMQEVVNKIEPALLRASFTLGVIGIDILIAAVLYEVWKKTDKYEEMEE